MINWNLEWWDMTHLNYLKARAMACAHHFDQKYGEHDYFNYHLCGVVSSMEHSHLSDECFIVGYLHDILEDTECTGNEILENFNQDILDAVIALTKGYYGEESRREYLKRVAKNEIARDVKMHDMSFNMLNCYKEGRIGKMSKYMADIRTLNEFIKEETN